MKRLLILLVVFAVMLSGCLGQDGDVVGNGSGTVSERENESYIQFEGKGLLCLDMPKEEVISQIGETEIIGVDGLHLYKWVQIQYKDDKVTAIYAMDYPRLDTSGLVTDQGLRFGMTHEDVVEIYGEPGKVNYANAGVGVDDGLYSMYYKLDRKGSLDEESWLAVDFADDEVIGLSCFMDISMIWVM